ncbi:MAG: hypothetical protein JWR37_5963 [Mycobacterium sp.]|nr:hypothetical protein [Mycobacterium sp.]
MRSTGGLCGLFPESTPQERAAIDTWNPLARVAPSYENFPKSQQIHRLTECPPEVRAAFASLRVRQDAWSIRQKQARHDFVDIMEHLWS